MKKIRKILYLIAAAGILSTAVSPGICKITAAESLPLHESSATAPDDAGDIQNISDVSCARTASAKAGHDQTAPAAQALKRMFVYNGRLYIDTNETSTLPRCGVMDGKIKKTVPADQKPSKELQSNFGRYSFQYGTRKNRIDVLIDDTWYIFAYNEDNLDGVSMNVTKNNARSAKIKITNSTDKKIIFGNDYMLEKRNKKTGEWRSVPYLIDNAAFDDIGYEAAKDVSKTWSVDWKLFHGTLKPGTYRIIKSFLVFRSTGDYTEYTLTAKFKVSDAKANK